jgi:hypothetical protein
MGVDHVGMMTLDQCRDVTRVPRSPLCQHTVRRLSSKKY